MQILMKIGLLGVLGVALVPPQNSRDYLQHLAGQKFILLRVAGSPETQVKEKDLGNLKGMCTAAVEVTTVAFEKSVLRFQLRNVGTVAGSNRHTICSLSSSYTLKIVDFDISQPTELAERAIANVLQTPEAYLASLGVSWNPSSYSENEPVIDLSRPGAKAPPGLIFPKVLLFVNPYYPGTSRAHGIEGTILLSCVMGTDGHVRDPVIEKGLSKELNQLALDAVTFYLVQPASDGTRAVAVRLPIQISFKL